MTEYKCNKCGGNKILIDGDTMTCLHCQNVWIEKTGKKIVQDG